MQGSAATHIFLLEQLLQRCVAQAAQHRLPVFFANAALALAELASQHQPQPAGAPTSAGVAVLRAVGEPRLAFSVSEAKGGKRAESGAVQVQRTVVTGVSPAAVVCNPAPSLWFLFEQGRCWLMYDVASVCAK